MNLIIQYKVDTIEQLKRAVRSQAKFKKKRASIVFSSVDSTSLIRFEFWCRQLISNYHKKHKHKIPISCSSLKLSGWKDPRDSGGHLPVRNFAFPADDADRRQSRHFRKVDNQSRFPKSGCSLCKPLHLPTMTGLRHWGWQTTRGRTPAKQRCRGRG